MINTEGRDPAVAEIVRHFRFDHLPPHLQPVSRVFHDAVKDLLHLVLADGDQLQVALLYLLQAKDAAVRAALP